MNKNNKRVSFHAVEIIDEFLYFSALNCNGLYRFKIGDTQAEFMGMFPGEKTNIRHLHGAIKGFEGKLYFAPFWGNCLSIFDIGKKEFTTIDLTSYTAGVRGKFYDLQIYQRKVILIPSRAKTLIVYDIDSQEIECHNEWVDLVDISINESIPQIKNGSFIHEGTLYIPFGKYAALLEINLSSFEVKVTEFKDIDCGFVDAIFMPEKNKAFLLANGKCSVYELNLNTKEIIEYASNEKFNGVSFPYLKMIEMSDSILLVMYQANYNLLFDKSTHVFKKNRFDVVDSASVKEWNANFYSGQRISGDEIILMGTGDYLIYVIDNACVLKRTFVLEDEMLVPRLMKKQEEAFFKEKTEINLNDFINYIL